MHKKFYVFLVVLLWIGSSMAQQFNNWYFPLNNGITFNTIPPSLVTNSQIDAQNFSCASISNYAGQTLFYSNGLRVWNKNNQVMPNGVGLKGEYCQINGLLIIPFLNDTSKYYLFTSQGLSYSSNRPDTLRYSYSVVDMRLDNGLGDVTQKNTFIRGFATEKMTAVRHANGTDMWWISRDWTNHFYSYKISCNGMDTTPVVSTVGNNINSDQNLLVGDIKASSNGKLICACYIGIGGIGYVELYQFNSATGHFSSAIRVPAKNPYGVEFSPNNQLVYVSQAYDTTTASNVPDICQYSLSVYDSTAIANSKVFLTRSYTLLPGIPGCLQLGPDNKIYYNGNGRTIDRIEQPDTPGLSCNFQDSIVLFTSFALRRLPYAAPFLFANQNVQIPTYTIAADCRTVTLTGRTYIRGNNLSFKWRFGDGDSLMQIVPSTGSDTTYTTVTHTFPAGIDTFNVQLFVTSDTVCGQGSAGKRIVFSLQRPTARFGYAANCGSLSVPFSDSSLTNSIPSLQYRWRFLDKAGTVLGTSTVQNSSFTFPLYDTVQAQLIISSTSACTRPDTVTQTLVLKAKPVATFTATNLCGSLQASFANSTTTATGTVQSSTWLFGDGSTSTVFNPAYTYNSFGNYTAKLVVTGSNGCTSDTAVQPIVIKAKPIARISYDTNTCAASPVLLRDNSTITGSTLQSYYWSVPALGLTSLQATIQPLFATGGSYTVLHVVTSAQGCTSDTLTQMMSVESLPVAAFASATQNGCAGSTLSFSPMATITYGQLAGGQWAIGNGQWATVTSSTFNNTFAQAGSYTVSYRAISSHGCTSNTATQMVNISSLPVARFSVDSAACTGKAVLFTNGSNGATSSTWSIGTAAPVTVTGAANYTYTFNQPGSYAVQLLVSTAAGCSSSSVNTVTVGSAAASAGQDITIRAGETFLLQGSGGIRYLWQPPTGLSSDTARRPSGLLTTSQLYTVQVATAEGCTGSDAVQVTVLQKLVLPNAFSPNGDGINDKWQVAALLDYPAATLQVYDRYGQLIHQTKGGSTTLWDGKRNGQPVAVGTYYYVLTLNSPLGDKPLTGWILVVR